MANRYWVGGTGNWSDDTNHWATSSGGSGGLGNLPTSSDDVFIDSNSGFGSGGTLTLDGTKSCHSFLSNAGHSFTFTKTSGWLNVYSNFSIESGLTWNTEIDFHGNGVDRTITTNGVLINNEVWFSSDTSSGNWLLNDNFNIGTDLYIWDGTFDANDKDITVGGKVDIYGTISTYHPTINMGSGTWTVSDGDWRVYGDLGETTLNAELSTILIVSAGRFFYSGDKTYYDVEFQNSSVGAYGNATFHNLTLTQGVGISVFEHSKTFTITGNLVASGSTGNLLTIDSDDSTNQFTISKSSGIVECDYLDISNSNAIGGANWYAGSHSVNTTNNSGWIFSDLPVPGVGSFLSKGIPIA